MSLLGLQCPQPLRKRPANAQVDYARRDRAIELFENGESYKALVETLRYLNPASKPAGVRQGPLFWTQGTAKVQIALSHDDQLSVSSALANVAVEPANPAALRYFLGNISSTGKLFQPRLTDGVVGLHFSEKLSLLHPQKLIEVLQKLPLEADNHDAWMQEELGCESVGRAVPKVLNASERKRALALWVQHWSDMDALMLESRRRRSMRFLDAIGRIAVGQIRYTLPLFGSLRRKLNQSADVFIDRESGARERESELVRCVRSMRDAKPEEVLACLGHVNYAVTPWNPGSAGVLRSAIGSVHHMHQSNEFRQSGRSMEATVEILANYLYLLAYFTWPPVIEHALRQTLNGVSGQPWRVACDVLWTRSQEISRQFAGGSDDGESSEADFDNDSESENQVFNPHSAKLEARS